MHLTCVDIFACIQVQSNKKMHDLYATKHIFQMVLPDAFWPVWSQIFFNILGKLRFLRY